jgi:hypothetical protein
LNSRPGLRPAVKNFSGCSSTVPLNKESSQAQTPIPLSELSTWEARTAFRLFDSSELALSNSPFDFQASIPVHWQVEYISEIEAINFYYPNVSETTSLEQSQLFIRTFTASEFLTLQTVTIHQQTSSTLNGRPAVTYDIEKTPEAANFPYQPPWRNQRHFVTDIRSTEASPTTFYVFAKRPELEQAIFETFLNSVKFNTATDS